MIDSRSRCPWPAENPEMIKYHDEEWGVPVYDDRVQFEFLILETFQSGLSWALIIKKRDNFRKAFDNFNYEKVARYDESKVKELLQDAGIIRNKLKINAAITNARAFIRIREEFGSFSKYLWGFVDDKPVINGYKQLEEIPPSTELSDLISSKLKKRGFKFVGSTVIYAHLQATGIVNDHLVNCYRYAELVKSS